MTRKAKPFYSDGGSSLVIYSHMRLRERMSRTSDESLARGAHVGTLLPSSGVRRRRARRTAMLRLKRLHKLENRVGKSLFLANRSSIIPLFNTEYG